MAAVIEEEVLWIGPADRPLLGVVARPAKGWHCRDLAVLIVVGGPQTRVGSHRQFVSLGRAIARAGYVALRFDYTGMGDSPGPRPDFERAGPDIDRACTELLRRFPSCRRIVLWGLCDGASAAMMHARSDRRVAGVVAVNPWARTESGRAGAIVKSHYRSRLASPIFWRRLLSGDVNVVKALGEAVSNVLKMRGPGAGRVTPSGDLPLSVRLANALESIERPTLIHLSGRDLTAAEFEQAMVGRRVLELPHVRVVRHSEADHTFSDPLHWAELLRIDLEFFDKEVAS